MMEPGGLQPWGCTESDTTTEATYSSSTAGYFYLIKALLLLYQVLALVLCMHYLNSHNKPER